MSCSATPGSRAVLAIARTQAERESGSPVSEADAQRAFHSLWREGRRLPMRLPDDRVINAWFDEREWTASTIMESARSRAAACANLSAARAAWREEPATLNPAMFHAWQNVADYAAYGAARQVQPNPLTIAFDCDGVLYGFNETLREWLVARGWNRDEMPDPTVYSLKDSWGLSNRTLHKEMPLAVQAGVLWHTGEPFDGGVGAARSAGLAGHSVVVNTARALDGIRPEAEAATISWLRRQGVHPDTLHLADPFDPTDKLSVPFDVLFDDHPDNVAAARNAGREAYLIDQPWNADAVGIPRVTFDGIPNAISQVQYARGATAA